MRTRLRDLRASLSGVGAAPAAVQAVAGVVLIAVLAAAVTVVLVAYRGGFSHHVDVSARMSGTGNAIEPGDQVRYRDVPVGTVVGQVEVVAPGVTQVRLHLTPSGAKQVPANTTALVQPASIFGTQAIVLQQPSAPTGHLTAGAVIPPATESSTSIQSTFADLDDILNAVHPAQLAQALSAVAQAVSGKGAEIGATLGTVSDYLHRLRPVLPTLGADLPLLATVAGQASAYVPTLISAVGHLTVTARTLSAEASQLAADLTSGDAAVRAGTTLVQQDGASIAHVTANVLPLLTQVAVRPNALPKTLAGIQQWTSAWASAITPNHTLLATIYLPVPDPYDFVAAGSAIGSKQLADQAFQTYLNPVTYTAADCPSYGTLKSTSCDRAQTAAQRQAIATAMIGISGRYDTSAAAAYLLEPVLVGATS